MVQYNTSESVYRLSDAIVEEIEELVYPCRHEGTDSPCLQCEQWFSRLLQSRGVNALDWFAKQLKKQEAEQTNKTNKITITNRREKW